MSSIYNHDSDNTAGNTSEHPNKTVGQIIHGAETNENLQNAARNGVETNDGEVPDGVLILGEEHGESRGDF